MLHQFLGPQTGLPVTRGRIDYARLSLRRCAGDIENWRWNAPAKANSDSYPISGSKLQRVPVKIAWRRHCESSGLKLRANCCRPLLRP